MTKIKFAGALFTAGAVLFAQAPPDRDEHGAKLADGDRPIFRTTVTARTTKAISYRHRSGSTKIDFRGTDILPEARGVADVNSKQGRIQIDVEFRDLQPATRNGAEYLTYVLWAITPEGRTANLGEVLLNGTKSNLHVTTDLQVFGLIVTAEPYFAVTQPSDYIVMENEIRADTVGKSELIEAQYELLKRGEYQRLSNPLQLTADRKLPLELYEARNAVQIARAEGADRFATDTFTKAENSLAQAEAYQARKAGEKPVAMTAREAVQTAEDARTIAVKRQEDMLLSAERKASLDRTARAESQSVAAQSETDRVTRDAEAARIKSLAESARLTQESARLTQEKDAQAAASQAEADRVRRDNDARLAGAAAEADRLKRENEAERAASQADLDAAAKQKARLETEKVELRSQLLQQFNAILQTRDTVRGLIVNMDDVLFDTAKFSLRPLAREKLAKVAGIVSGHPGLRLAVEGHTDSVGGDEYNQTLSDQRGGSVRDFLILQGMQPDSVTATGFGKADPVASNDTASGRQQNRRVEIVISGELIGTVITVADVAR